MAPFINAVCVAQRGVRAEGRGAGAAGVCVWGEYIYMNDAAVAILGWEIKEKKGRRK